MNEYGTILRVTRERLGISIEDASNDTKITVKMIQALESMKKDVFPADTYLKGTLELYARYLRLEPAKMIELLELNSIQEKPVEFDMINLQQKKNQKRKKHFFLFLVLAVLIVLGAMGIIYRGAITSIFSRFNRQEKDPKETSLEGLMKITGLYESEFSEGEQVALVGSQYSIVLTIQSVEDSIIVVGNQSLELALNVPYQLDVDNDGNLDYLLIMRERNVETGTILLRFDPRVNNQNLIEDNLLEQIPFPTVDADSEVLDILRRGERAPITITLEFTDETYFRVVSGGAVLAEQIGNKNLPYQYSLSLHGTVYLALDTFAQITVNNTVLDLEKKNQPLVFDLLWRQEQQEEVLKFVPRS